MIDRLGTLTSIFLGLLLTAAVITPLNASPQGNAEKADRAGAPPRPHSSDHSANKDGLERDGDGVERIYDRDRRDYHRWDEAEEGAYRSFWEEHHRAYRPYSSLNRREQSHYWKWRHAVQKQASLSPITPPRSSVTSANKVVR